METIFKKINWKKRCLLLEEYLSLELGKTSEDFKKWLKINHPKEKYESKYNQGNE